MGMCKICGDVVNANLMIDGICPNCQTPEDSTKRENILKIEEMSPKEKARVLNDLILTTETFINDPIVNRLGIVTAKRVYGMNIVKDIFSSIRDIVGGRVHNIENSMNDAIEEIEEEIKLKALELGGNAIIGYKIEHSFSASNMVSFFASGTVVTLNNQ